MDLSTIQKNMDEGFYTKKEDFEADVLLIFENCFAVRPLPKTRIWFFRDL